MEVTVIDVGCAKWGEAESIPYLVERFQPRLLIGLDPAATNDCYFVAGTSVITFGVAAWTHVGEVGYIESGTRSHISMEGRQVGCFDLGRLVEQFGPKVILKIDAEGSEYPLLRDIIERKLDEMIQLALVEWHDPDDGRMDIIRRLSCPYEEWTL